MQPPALIFILSTRIIMHTQRKCIHHIKPNYQLESSNYPVLFMLCIYNKEWLTMIRICAIFSLASFRTFTWMYRGIQYGNFLPNWWGNVLQCSFCSCHLAFSWMNIYSIKAHINQTLLLIIIILLQVFKTNTQTTFNVYYEASFKSFIAYNQVELKYSVQVMEKPFFFRKKIVNKIFGTKHS
mgnify:CR=1 FL=1